MFRLGKRRQPTEILKISAYAEMAELCLQECDMKIVSNRKKNYWLVQIEIFGDGSVKAAVIRKQAFYKQPPDKCKAEPRRVIYSVWFRSVITAQEAVLEALKNLIGFSNAELAA